MISANILGGRMFENNTEKKRFFLATLISLSGLFSFANSTLFVKDLSTDTVSEMISVLSNGDLQPAQFVAAVTSPGNSKNKEVKSLKNSDTKKKS